MTKSLPLGLLGSALLALIPSFTPAAHAQFNASFYNFPGATGNIDAAEALFAGTPAATATPATINYSGDAGTGNVSGNIGGDVLFPSGVNQDDFGMDVTGVVRGLSGPTPFILGVNSDDGFRLRLNGTTIAELTTPRPAGDTFTAPLTLSNGDVLRLTYFEDAGAQEVEFFTGGPGQAHFLVGDPASGLGVVPEPATWVMMVATGGLGLGFVARRRVRRTA